MCWLCWGWHRRPATECSLCQRWVACSTCLYNVLAKLLEPAPESGHGWGCRFAWDGCGPTYLALLALGL